MEAVFGAGPETEDMFMAWHYARYIGKVAEAGNYPSFYRHLARHARLPYTDWWLHQDANTFLEAAQ